METCSDIDLECTYPRSFHAEFGACSFTKLDLILTSRNGYQYVNFQPIWTYIYNPVLGSLCLGNGYSVPEGTVNRYVVR